MNTLLKPNSLMPHVDRNPFDFCFDELLCAELLTRLQTYLTPGTKWLRLSRVRDDRASVHMLDAGHTTRVLWLYADNVRDWFIARYSHDVQLMQEIEQDILAEFGAQLSRRMTG
ncbi:MAG: hypothetical protein WBR15_00990 [Gammaproteobacteria bacterium]